MISIPPNYTIMTKHNSIFVFLLNDDERMADSGSNKEQNDDKQKNADPIQQDNEKNNTGYFYEWTCFCAHLSHSFHGYSWV